MNNLKELYFNFEGKDYTAKLTIKKHASLDFYYVSIPDPQLNTRFTVSYIFGFARSLGVQYISSFQRTEDRPLVDCLCDALEKYIQNAPTKEQLRNSNKPEN